MSRRLSVDEYLASEETLHRQELRRGFVVREPAAPSWDHQIILGRLFERLRAHIEAHGLGEVVCAPVDVVLDRWNALVVQPHIVFISTERLSIVTAHVEGAPDLVVEMLSTTTARHDRTRKLGWYRTYGARECWLLDPVSRSIEIADLTTEGPTTYHEGDDPVRSRVLAGVSFSVEDVSRPRTGSIDI